MLDVMRAAGHARDYLATAKDGAGDYQLTQWPDVAPEQRGRAGVGSAVVRLRLLQRLLVGFLDPVDDAIFLTVGLRSLGFHAEFHIGRELVPVKPPGGYYAWVSHQGTVVSTSIPVQQEYVDVGHC